MTAKTAKPMTCPVCGEAIQPGQSHRNTIYAQRDGIPISAQAHYPSCYRAMHPRPQVATQPVLFATALN